MIRIRIEESLSDEIHGVINEELRRFNLENNPAFFAACELQANAPRPLYGVARDSDESILGGMLAATQFAWLKVSVLAVVASARGRGIGSRLTAAAEAEAVVRGCRYAYADTMDYQAPGFYQKLGYRIVGRLEDWDSNGHAKLFFAKQLD